MKNTTGYSLNAFLDFARPVDIFRNLLVGSEGTLAFIAEAVLRTVPDLPVKVTGFLLFPGHPRRLRRHRAPAGRRRRGPGAAGPGLPALGAGPAGHPPGIKDLPEGAAALLAEFQGADEGQPPGPGAPGPGGLRGPGPAGARRLHPRPGGAGPALEDPRRAPSPPWAPCAPGAPR